MNSARSQERRSNERRHAMKRGAFIGLVASVEETTTEDFERLFRVNVEGTFFVTRAAMPLLLASQGNIVNIGSCAGVKGFRRRFTVGCS